ncbi:hypothetical protein [Streptomyces xanthophaeus]
MTGPPTHPRMVGPYEVSERLGAGAMGEVYLARSPHARGSAGR